MSRSGPPRPPRRGRRRRRPAAGRPRPPSGTWPRCRGGRGRGGRPAPADRVDLPDPAGPSMATVTGPAHRPAPASAVEVVGEPGVAGGDRLPPRDDRRRAADGPAAAATAAAMAIRWSPAASTCPATAWRRPRRRGRPPRRRPTPPKARTSAGGALQPVGLLDPQLADVAEPGRPVGHQRRPRPGSAPRRGTGSRPPPPWCRCSGRRVGGDRAHVAADVVERRRRRPSGCSTCEEADALGDPGGRCSTVTRLPGTTAPATTQNAAWDGSPGTSQARAPQRRRAGGAPPGPRPVGSTLDVGPGLGQHLLGVGPGGHRLAHDRVARRRRDRRAARHP